MATLTIRNLPDDVHDKFRVRAAENGRSMEEEARQVIADAVRNGGRVVTEASWRTSIREAQEAFKPLRDPDTSVIDEFLEQRRAEALREEKKWRRLEEEAKAARPSAAAGPARETQSDKLARARAVLRRHVPEGAGLVDEFLAERRSMWGEN